jgi:MFS family permease
MTATRKDAAGGHYTLLVSGNALGIGVAGLLGGLAADHVERGPVFVVAAIGAAVPIVLLGGWSEEARRSAGTAAVPGGRAAEAVASTDDPR